MAATTDPKLLAAFNHLTKVLKLSAEATKNLTKKGYKVENLIDFPGHWYCELTLYHDFLPKIEFNNPINLQVYFAFKTLLNIR